MARVADQPDSASCQAGSARVRILRLGVSTRAFREAPRELLRLPSRVRRCAAAAALPVLVRTRPALRAFGHDHGLGPTNDQLDSAKHGTGGPSPGVIQDGNQPPDAQPGRQIAASSHTVPRTEHPSPDALPKPCSAHVDITERFICLEVVEAALWGHARPRVQEGRRRYTRGAPLTFVTVTSKILSRLERACRLDVSILFGNLCARAQSCR